MSTERTRPRPSARERYRYILFRLETKSAPPDRDALIRLLQARLDATCRPWLTRYDGERGILRVARGTERLARAQLEAIGDAATRLRPLLTSGTIARLEREGPKGRLRRGDG